MKQDEFAESLGIAAARTLTIALMGGVGKVAFRGVFLG